MQTGKKSFKELIPGQELFYVPRYQRNYSWEEEHRKDLWEDLLESLDKTHYIGTVLIESSGGEGGSLYEEIGIIDGQQRITTLTILLFELQRWFREHDRDRYARNILSKYIVAEDQQRLRLQENEDARFFREYVLESVIDPDLSTQRKDPTSELTLNTPSKRRLAETKDFFRTKLKEAPPDPAEFQDEVEFCEALYDTIQNLDLLAYVVESRAEAARIFQTVNDRGKGLTDLEITKSYLMHRLALTTEESNDSRTEELIRKVQESFNQMYSDIERISDTRVGSGLDEDQVQRYHFITWNPEWTTGHRDRLYQDHLTHVKAAFETNGGDLPERIIDYAQELERTFLLLRELVTAEKIEDARLRSRLRNLFAVGRLGNFYPLLITAYDQKKRGLVTSEQFRRLLEKIETFIVRTYLIEQKAADTGRTKAYPLARQFYYSDPDRQADGITPKSVGAVIDALGAHIHNYCSDTTLEENLFDSEVYPYFAESNRLSELRYLLYAYELHLEEQREGIPFDVQDVVNNRDHRFTVEHIWPRNPPADMEDSRRETVHTNTHRLGNLTLMTLEDNAFHSNDSFAEKRQKFEGSKFRMLNRVFENEGWSVDRIAERERRMIKAIKSRWPDKRSSDT